jgi:glucose/arabinose dehydrogenase
VDGALTTDGRGAWFLTADGHLEVTGLAARLGSPRLGPPPRPGTVDGEPVVGVEQVADLSEVVSLAVRPDDPDGLWLAQRIGYVVRLDRTRTYARGEEPAPVVDLSAVTEARIERGLMAIAWHPDGTRLYVLYTDLQDQLRLVELTVSDGEEPEVTSGPREVLSVHQEFFNHNGGGLAFGSDGYLYIGSGDGGSDGDPRGNGQDPTTLQGTILRIDPTATATAPYRVPPDNPASGAHPGWAPEVWHIGLRNPWRFAFDEATGDLWIGEVGQSRREEILRAPVGEGGLNFGWKRFEGTLVFDADAALASEPVSPPLFEIGHSDGSCAIVGGVVAHSPSLPDLDGAYLFGDFCTGVLRYLTVDPRDPDRVQDVADLGRVLPLLAGFGTDAAGEVYALGLGGPVWRLTAPDGPPPA